MLPRPRSSLSVFGLALLLCAGALLAEEKLPVTPWGGFQGKFTAREGKTIAEYDFRHTNQHSDFVNGSARVTIVSRGPGKHTLEEFQESGRLGFDANELVSWKLPARSIDSFKIKFGNADQFKLEFKSASGSVAAVFGAASQLVATPKEGKKKSAKPAKFKLEKEKTYTLQMRLEKGSIIVLVDEQKAMKLELPGTLKEFSSFQFTSENSEVNIYAITIEGMLDEKAAGPPEDAKAKKE